MQVNLQTCPPVVAIKSPTVSRKSQPVSIGNSIPCSLASLYPTPHAFRCQIKTIYVTNRFRRKHLTKQAAGLAGGNCDHTLTLPRNFPSAVPAIYFLFELATKQYQLTADSWSKKEKKDTSSRIQCLK